MCTKALKKWALLLTFWVALHARHLQAQTISGNTVDGNLTVTGTSDFQGNSLTLGTRTDDSNPGAMALYTDGTTSTLEFDSSRSANIWKWQQNGGTTLQLQMSLNLSNQNELVLYNQASTPVAKIILNPLGASTFQNSLTVNGTDNEMPNQTLVNGNSVLTESLADSRYASGSVITTGSAAYDGITGPTLSLNGGIATGPYSFAEGSHSTASSFYSTAMGNSTASSAYATAMGNSIASGGNATAMGNSTANSLDTTAMGRSTASGWYTTAMGVSTASGYFDSAMGGSTANGWACATAMGSSTASGPYATAMGASTASGTYATAMGQSSASGFWATASGNDTTAQAYDSFVIGSCNVGGGNLSVWVSTDPLFEIGNGIVPTGANNWTASPSDALVVYKNGNTSVQGSLSAGGPITTTGAISGASVSSTGTVTAPTFVTTALHGSGDIPMYQGN